MNYCLGNLLNTHSVKVSLLKRHFSSKKSFKENSCQVMIHNMPIYHLNDPQCAHVESIYVHLLGMYSIDGPTHIKQCVGGEQRNSMLSLIVFQESCVQCIHIYGI